MWEVEKLSMRFWCLSKIIRFTYYRNIIKMVRGYADIWFLITLTTFYDELVVKKTRIILNAFRIISNNQLLYNFVCNNIFPTQSDAASKKLHIRAVPASYLFVLAHRFWGYPPKSIATNLGTIQAILEGMHPSVYWTKNCHFQPETHCLCGILR